MTNHLGNVLATISDQWRTTCDGDGGFIHYEAVVTQATDYSAFGAPLPGRTFVLAGASKTRFGFNGEMLENEISGEGNDYDLGERFYDARLGRMFSLDPLEKKYASWSSYSYSCNSPVGIIDYNGLGPTDAVDDDNQNQQNQPANSSNSLEEKVTDANSTALGGLNNIKITVTNEQTGWGLVKGYPDKNENLAYVVPIYKMIVEGTNCMGIKETFTFDVIRFGVYASDGKKPDGSVDTHHPPAVPYVYGVNGNETDKIVMFVPDFLSSRTDIDHGAWTVDKKGYEIGSFLLHAGADNPQAQAYGAIGCIEVVGKGEFKYLNKVINYLSGLSCNPAQFYSWNVVPTGTPPDNNLIKIGKSQAITITYQNTPTPPLLPVSTRPPTKR